MVVALTMIFYLEWARNITSYTMIVAAFLGSLLSVGFILLMSRRIKNMAGLLVGGIMIGYICSAVTDFVVTFAEDSDIVNLHGWSQGSFSGMSWKQRSDLCGCDRHHLCHHVPDGKTDRCISAR